MSRELLEAVENGNIESVKKALSEGADINCKDDCERTPLMIAALNKDFDMVKLLLAQPGINLDQKEQDGFTAISLIFECDENINKDTYDMVELLSKSGSNLNVIHYHSTILEHALRNKDETISFELGKILVENGASIELAINNFNKHRHSDDASKKFREAIYNLKNYINERNEKAKLSGRALIKLDAQEKLPLEIQQEHIGRFLEAPPFLQQFAIGLSLEKIKQEKEKQSSVKDKIKPSSVKDKSKL